ncbi:hypothetical protein AB0B89_27150 [Sphaerisporangium sp. NPDC049002]|uniref:hypothetical protein n=1 Tax=Sphaerisporangium sp. NPDC049002 TaxID=3155392 RepID=UPI0033BFE53E
MPFKSWTVGEILTAADLNSYLMSQVIIRCTSGTRPASPAQGWHIYETDTSKFLVYTGSAWVPEGSQRRQKTKSADETVNNSTAVQDDDHLFLSVDANTNYLVEALIVYNSNSTADFQMGWSGPSGATFTWASGGMDTTVSGSLGSIDLKSRDIATTADSGGWNFSDLIVRPAGRLAVGATAGTFRFRWAQNTANASNTIVRSGSVLMLTTLV